MESLIGMENLPNEIVLQILGYLSFWEVIQCARVSKRLNNICKDRSLRYSSSMSVMKKQTAKHQKSILDILIARPEVTEVILRNPSNHSKTRKKRVRTQDYREHNKAALHFIISKNKLVLQVFYLSLSVSTDPYRWSRLSRY